MRSKCRLHVSVYFKTARVKAMYQLLVFEQNLLINLILFLFGLKVHLRFELNVLIKFVS